MKKLEGWGKKKLKYIVSIQKGKVPKEILTTNFNNELPVYLTMDYLRGVSKQIYYVPNFDKYIVVEDNEILLLWDGSNAGEFLWSKKGVLSSTMAVVKPNNEINKQFLFYRFKDFERYLKDITVGMGIPHVNPQEFLNFSFFIPSLNEQSLIANYLDRKTAEIDDLIAKKERLIELYEEEKRAIINKAVTKGLNPNVKMKDSGIPWLGEIPEHWEVKKLKYVAKVNSSNIDKKSRKGEKEIFLCNYTDVYNNDYIDHNINFMKATANSIQIKKFRLRKDDVIITKDSETPYDIGIPAYVCENFDAVICGYHLTHIKPYKIVGKYLFRQFQCKFIQSYFEVSANGITRYGLGIDKINSTLILIPPHSEQQQIVSYIEKQISLIDSKIKKTKKMIELLKEYKTSLISEVVTGKRKIMED